MKDAVDEVLNDPNSGFVKAGEKPAETPPEATPAPETPVVETPSAETPPAQETPPVETPPETPAWDFKLDEFNKRYGLDFKDEDNLKSFFEKGSKLSEIETELNGLKEQLPYYQEVEQTLRDFVDTNDPIKVYGSEEAYKDALAIRKLSQEGRNEAVVTKAIKSNLGTMSDLDVLTMKKEFDSPSVVGETEAIKRSILRSVGVDIDEWEKENDKRYDVNTPDLTPEQKVGIASMADIARNEIRSLKSSIEVPEYKSPLEGLKEKIKQDQETRDKRVQDWEKQGDRLTSEFSKIEKRSKDKEGKDIVDFVYEIDPSFKSDIKQMVVDYAKERGIEPTQENVAEVKKLIKSTYLAEDGNLEKLLDAYGTERESRVIEKTDSTIHNPTPINKDDAPPTKEAEDADKFNEKVEGWFK